MSRRYPRGFYAAEFDSGGMATVLFCDGEFFYGIGSSGKVDLSSLDSISERPFDPIKVEGISMIAINETSLASFGRE